MHEPKIVDLPVKKSEQEKQHFAVVVQSPVSEKSSHHENHDRATTIELPRGRGTVLVVCDGVSSLENSARAAEIFIETVQAALSHAFPPPSAIQETLVLAASMDDTDASITEAPTEPDYPVDHQLLFFQEIFQRANTNVRRELTGHRNMATGQTTALVIYIETDETARASVYWVGDSRAYVQRANENMPLLLTLDDSVVVSEAIKKGMSLSEIFSAYHAQDSAADPTPARDAFIKKVYDLGDPPFNKMIYRLAGLLTRGIGLKTKESAPHLHRVLLSLGDRIIGVTDGVSDCLSLSEIGASRTPTELVRRAGEAMDTRHKDDDKTAIIATVGEAIKKRTE